MLIRSAILASLLAVLGYTSAALANSCSNVDVIGTFDESGLREIDYGIHAVGTFRIAGEDDESKQPMFNLATIDCEKSFGSTNFECKVWEAVVLAKSGKPDQDHPNCSLDLDSSIFSMKELQKGVLTGIETSTGCFNKMLTIDRTGKRVYMSFTRTTYADDYDKIMPGACGMLPRTQVLMNCTEWPRIRSGLKGDRMPARYCDFSNSTDK